MRGEVLQLFRLHRVQEDVAVQRRVRFVQGDPAPVARDVADLEALVVLVHQGPLVGLCVVAIEVEELRIALVSLDPKGRPIAAPAVELRLQLFARRQIPLFAVRLAHVEVVELVAALIVRVENAVAVREVRDRVGRVRRRGRQRSRRPTRIRNRNRLRRRTLPHHRRSKRQRRRGEKA